MIFKDKDKVADTLNAACTEIERIAGEPLGLVIIAIPIPSQIKSSTAMLVSSNSPERSLIPMLIELALERTKDHIDKLEGMN
jgi:hypothetical protein